MSIAPGRSGNNTAGVRFLDNPPRRAVADGRETRDEARGTSFICRPSSLQVLVCDYAGYPEHGQQHSYGDSANNSAKDNYYQRLYKNRSTFNRSFEFFLVKD